MGSGRWPCRAFREGVNMAVLTNMAVIYTMAVVEE